MPDLQAKISRDKLPVFDQILARIRIDYPQTAFVEGPRFTWDPRARQILYQKKPDNNAHAIFSILHELGHAILQHKDYINDINLLQLETEAWSEARLMAEHYDIELDEHHIEDCLDSYRDWLHLRATCPNCFTRALQASRDRYDCFNCQSSWKVTSSRLCRSYRLKTT